jgi:iron complex transport system permease protein
LSSRKKTISPFILAASLLVAVFVISMATGQVSLSVTQLGRTLIGQGTDIENLILFEFRLPRILVTILAGMGLAVAGAILQSITNNPLSEPGILGINAGAGLMVVVYILFFTAEPTTFLYLLPLFALLGGILAAMVTYLLAFKKGEGANPIRIILIGVGMAAAMNGAILTLSTRLPEEQHDFFANWIAGRIWGDDWTFVLALLPWLTVFLPIVMSKANVLNILHTNDQVAIGLGINVERERLILLFIAVALASASVSVTGGIAFVGLIAPHLARAWVGHSFQLLLPIAAFLGGTLLLLADTIGRVLLDPSGIPAGVIVSVIGTIYFLYLMMKQ